MDTYRSLDDLDVLVEGSKPSLEPNEEELKKYQEAFWYNYAKEEINYRIWKHDFFPKKRRYRR